MFSFSYLTRFLLAIKSSDIRNATVSERSEYISVSLAMVEERREMESIVSESFSCAYTGALAGDSVSPTDVGWLSCHALCSSEKYLLNAANILSIANL